MSTLLEDQILTAKYEIIYNTQFTIQTNCFRIFHTNTEMTEIASIAFRRK
jgi:hypothetical protein